MHDSKALPCPECGHSSDASEHLVVNLPAFTCRSCKADLHVNFKFCYGNLNINGICPIGEIKDQLETDFCVPFGFTMAAEISVGIKAFLAGNIMGNPTLDPYFLLADHFEGMPTRRKRKFPKFDAYEVAKKHILSLDEAKLPDFQSLDAIDSMANLLMSKGIYSEGQWYKVGVDRVDNNFKSISTSLADGHPLAVNVVTGKSFRDLNYGDIYKAPCNSTSFLDGQIPDSLDSHFVVIVGACRSDHGDYLYFVNSYGRLFRMRTKAGKQLGGIGKLCAGDVIRQPYRILRCVVDQ